MTITATELKENLGRYLELASTEDIIVSKHGVPVARLTAPGSSRVERMRSLFGILPWSVSVEDARAIRGEEKWGLS